MTTKHKWTVFGNNLNILVEDLEKKGYNVKNTELINSDDNKKVYEITLEKSSKIKNLNQTSNKPYRRKMSSSRITKGKY